MVIDGEVEGHQNSFALDGTFSKGAEVVAQARHSVSTAGYRPFTLTLFSCPPQNGLGRPRWYTHCTHAV